MSYEYLSAARVPDTFPKPRARLMTPHGSYDSYHLVWESGYAANLWPVEEYLDRQGIKGAQRFFIKALNGPYMREGDGFLGSRSYGDDGVSSDDFFAVRQ